MSSKSVDKEQEQANLGGRDFISKAPVNFKHLVIEFSNFGKSEKIHYIYIGNEKISFRDRHPIYQTIFRNEFAEETRDIIKNF